MNKIAQYLLETKSVHLNTKELFTWTSGIKSPIYCDNRKLISHPKIRDEITDFFVTLIKNNFKDVEVIAGTATAGIPWASWISHKLNLPMIYIRSSEKGHGLKNQIEGELKSNQKTLIIEDLISTGGSSVKAAISAKEAGADVLSVLSIFNYNFIKAKNEFKNNHFQYVSLCTLDELLPTASELNYISKSDQDFIINWKKDF